MRTEILKVLRHARALVERRWCQRMSVVMTPDDITCYCATGALRRAVELHLAELAPGAIYEATAALVAQLPAGFTSISGYNDDPATTQRDVLALYDRAIAAAAAAAEETL